MAGEAREKCAVGGIVGTDPTLPAAALMYEMLFAQQHRGAEASGIATLQADGSTELHRNAGVVKDVYSEEDIIRLTGDTAIGHNKYSTNGNKLKHIQPFADEALGFASGHNGNLPVTNQLDLQLEKHNVRTKHFNDSEKMGLAVSRYIADGHDLPDAVQLAYPLFRGSFSSIMMHDDMVVAFRDRKGIRPLALGSFAGGYAVASETCALKIIDATYDREVKPGEMVIITKDGIESRQLDEGEERLDIFEYVYFARHDSMLYGKSVNEVRRQFGVQLALQHPPITDDAKNILVVPVPDTSIPAAEGYAETLGLINRQAIIKNRFIGRTFMLPDHLARTQHLRRKHNIVENSMKNSNPGYAQYLKDLEQAIRDGAPLPEKQEPFLMRGKDVVIIDDSIVRLNTIPGIVAQAKADGANSVAVLIASPPVRFPDHYGIDTPSQKELAAANLTVEQMRDKIDCDYLGFLSLSRMVEATGLPHSKFSLACFNNDYPIGIGERKKEIYTPVSMEFAD